MVTIGIDPHKSSHTAVALDRERRPARRAARAGRQLDIGDAERMGRAAGRSDVWAIEGAGGLGRLLAQQLVAAGEAVVDVPSALAARARVLQRGHGRKSDGIDARSVAVVAQTPQRPPAGRGPTITAPSCGCCPTAATS